MSPEAPRRLAVDILARDYRERRGEIERRLMEFEEVGRRGSEEELFAELCFCICTPQSSARAGLKAQKRLTETGLLIRGKTEEIRELLEGVRFSGAKARYIVEARRFLSKGGGLSVRQLLHPDPQVARRNIAEKIAGVGYKEASHFLRNIGYRGLAILDRHILSSMEELGVIESVPSSLSRRRYLELEGRFHKLAKELGIPSDHLDLLLWSRKTGEVLK